ncbi:MAG: hypothetical protein JWO03_3422 [Bacteroidetes bacterium]|nr:hypothetical protein [Bacteroidota bacterium]
MKTTLYIIAVLIISAALSIGLWYFYKSSQYEAYVLIDITDPSIQQIDSSAIFSDAIAEIHTWGSAEIHVSTLTDFDYNSVQTASLHASFIPLGNPDNRQKSIAQFTSDFKDAISKVYLADLGRSQSSIYVPLVRSLNILSSSHAKVKKLYVYSDLLLNTDSFSMYRANDLSLIEKDPVKVSSKLENEAMPGNLQGITVFFIYQAKNREDERKHLLIAKVLEAILTAHHAQVEILTNYSTD